MHPDDEESRWSNDAVKDWAFALLINAPFPLCVLVATSVSGQYQVIQEAVWYWPGAFAAAMMVLVLGAPFAGLQSRIFVRLIDGVYVLALGQIVPFAQFLIVGLSFGLWNYASPWGRSSYGKYPLLAAYFIAFVYCQLSLAAAFVLGCVYRKPRNYPRWLRPWNHEFDRIHDTLTRR